MDDKPYKPPRYNDKIAKIHDPNGVPLKLVTKLSAIEAWNGPVKGSLTLEALAQNLRCSDEPIDFYYKDTKITPDRFGQTIKVLQKELADSDPQPNQDLEKDRDKNEENNSKEEKDEKEERGPKVLELDFWACGGTDCGLIKNTEKGEIQSMELSLDTMKRNLPQPQVQEWCTKSLFVASKRGFPKKVQLLLKEGADIKKIDKLGNTALLVAARKGHKEVVILLIKEGADKEAEDPEGHTPLLLAAKCGSLQTVRLLLSEMASIHAINQEGNTALMLAAMGGNGDIITELMKWSADANAANRYRFTSLHLAAKEGHTSAVKVLLQEKANLDHGNGGADSPLLLALKGWNMEMVKLLIEKGADVNAWNEDGMTPLLQIAILGQTEMVQLLVENRADINAKVTGCNALQLAARHGQAETAACLKKELEKLLCPEMSRWQRRKYAILNEAISGSIQIAKKRGHKHVVKLLKPKEPKNRG